MKNTNTAWHQQNKSVDYFGSPCKGLGVSAEVNAEIAHPPNCKQQEEANREEKRLDCHESA